MYIKPGKTFVLSKKSKSMIALMGGPKEGRDQFKRMMIQAELAAAIVPKTEKRDRNAPRGNTNNASTDSTQA
jgi:hypothetical protein